MRTKRYVFLMALCAGFLLAAVAAEPAAIVPVPACPDCNCYWSSDCASGEYCNWSSGCRKVGKKDGTCTKRATTASWNGVDSGLVADVADLYFQSYLTTLETSGEGGPDQVLFATAAATRLDTRGAWQREVLNTVHTALDFALGFDVDQPAESNMANLPPCAIDANLRAGTEPDGAPVAIVQAVRTGVVAAFRTGRADAVIAPLEEFWTQFPDYHPRHTGRCYPHGHSEHPEPPIECQTEGLLQLMAVMLQGQ